jgi:hypothetical protein
MDWHIILNVWTLFQTTTARCTATNVCQETNARNTKESQSTSQDVHMDTSAVDHVSKLCKYRIVMSSVEHVNNFWKYRMNQLPVLLIGVRKEFGIGNIKVCVYWAGQFGSPPARDTPNVWVGYLNLSSIWSGPLGH